MLASSFKTAAELLLDDSEYIALCRTLAFFEQDQVAFIKHESIVFHGIPTGQFFNMMTWQSGECTVKTGIHNCGTAACIGGWANILAGKDEFSFPPNRNHRELMQLFVGSNSKIPRCDITVADAARCLRHYLETGNVLWDRAIET